MRSFFVTTAPGLESLAADEMRSLGLKIRNEVRGGLEVRGKLGAALRAHLYGRTIHRIYLRVDAAPIRSFSALESWAASLPWGTWIQKGQPFQVQAHAKHSKLYHSGGIAERVARGIAKATSAHHLPEDGPHQKVMVRLEDDLCTVSLDMSGDLLHRRGYKENAWRAPLRESMACALLRFAGWDGTRSLVDPMCGSGTFPTEAAWIAAGVAPGSRRRFAFESWPSLPAQMWSSLKEEAQGVGSGALPVIQGSDRREEAVNAARENALRAGVEIDLSCKDVSEIVLPKEPGLLVCNAPYGDRIGSVKALVPVYRKLGATMKEQHNWDLMLLATRPDLIRVFHKALGRKATREVKFSHGGLQVRAIYVQGQV